jgi:hypothetical protein
MAALTAPPAHLDAAFYSSNIGSIPPGLYSTFNGMSINNTTDAGVTGATTHMASNPGILTTPSSSLVHHHVVVGNGNVLAIPLSLHLHLLFIFATS